ncbi:MAG TPA: OmpA family protein [Paludibacter sp.]|nr:OmpA family protein [Paludibacter sp.]
MHKNNKTSKALFLLLFSLTILIDATAQLESSKWVFGHGAGIDFQSGTPVAFSGSKIKTTEGCSTIADEKGNLLFYTDGISVWNKDNELMPNGTDLKGNVSATQSTIIVPKPGNKSIFYIFTVDSEGGKNGFCYSLVDMSKEKGLGDVIMKGQTINQRSTEKLMAAMHQNQVDIWIIVHEYESDVFLSYLLTKNGLSSNPVVSVIGMKHDKSIYNTIGYMKISSDKKKLALAINGNRKVQVFDFNNTNGLVSNPVTVSFDTQNFPYGIEFSPDNSLLYIGMVSNGSLYQLNLKSGNETDIQNSLTLVGKSNSNKLLGALQLGIDGRIYIAEYNSKFLSVVENPNAAGKGCLYKPGAFSLGDNTSMLGLPGFIQDFVAPTGPGTGNTVERTTFKKHTVYFDFNKVDPNENYNKELRYLVDSLKDNENLSVEIIGHTDSIGNNEYNKKLSLSRAREIGNYLISNGIERSHVIISGKGSDEPMDTNKTEKGRKKNRRVEFILKNQGDTTRH